MKIFKYYIKCKECLNNVNNKCMLFNGKDVNEKDAGCYNGLPVSPAKHYIGARKSRSHFNIYK